MDLGAQEGAGEMPMPISSSYSALHESAKMKMLTSGNGTGADDTNANNSGVPPQLLLRPMPAVQQPPVMDSSNSTVKALVPLPIGTPVVTGLGGTTPATASATPTPTGPGIATPTGGKKAVRYRECHKNHAASIGGHAIDGCGEFMPSGEEGTLDALKCAACDCHRNFHRREVEGEPSCDCHMRGLQGSVKDRKRSNSVGPVAVGGGPSPGLGIPPTLALPSSLGMRTSTPTPILMALSSGAADSDDQELGLGSASPAAMKKRFRTKFSTEQKEKMCSFADKLGWKIQKHDEAAVQQFCSDVGVKRHVLKVWMHNNKHTLGKKILDVPTQQQQLVVAGPA